MKMQSTIYHKGMRVATSDVYDATKVCPVCSSETPRTPVLRLQDDPTIDMLECSFCGASSASYMPTVEFLTRYYDQYYTGVSDKYTFGDPARFAQHVLAPMAGISDIGGISDASEMRILDFGGGDGSHAIALARELRGKVGRKLTIVIDLVDYASPNKSDDPAIVVKGYATLADVCGNYDIILASSVLEHIPDAYATIRRLFQLAKRGTYFYARTPFVLPIAKRIPGFNLTYPAHVHDMGSVFWNQSPRTFGVDAQILSSRPSIVESTLKRNPFRTLVAHALKTPAMIELAFMGRTRPPLWNFVGGWEIVVRFN
jgi:hypothetical protein